MPDLLTLFPGLVEPAAVTGGRAASDRTTPDNTTAVASPEAAFTDTDIVDRDPHDPVAPRSGGRGARGAVSRYRRSGRAAPRRARDQYPRTARGQRSDRAAQPSAHRAAARFGADRVACSAAAQPEETARINTARDLHAGNSGKVCGLQTDKCAWPVCPGDVREEPRTPYGVLRVLHLYAGRVGRGPARASGGGWDRRVTSSNLN